MAALTVGQALRDERTALGRAAKQQQVDHAARLVQAREIMASEGLTLEQAFQRVWGMSA